MKIEIENLFPSQNWAYGWAQLQGFEGLPIAFC